MILRTFTSAKKNKQVKLINFGDVAINLTFFEKHTYKIDKEPSPDEVFEILNKRCDELHDFINQGYLFAGKFHNERKVSEIVQLEDIKKTLLNFENYEFAISNYSGNFIFWYVSYMFRLEDGNLDFASEHLLTSEKDHFGKTTLPKINIIFIDTDFISVHTPYQNKKI